MQLADVYQVNINSHKFIRENFIVSAHRPFPL